LLGVDGVLVHTGDVKHQLVAVCLGGHSLILDAQVCYGVGDVVGRGDVRTGETARNGFCR
jgi:hypothetical protein